jgi:hypothetical protein
MELAQAGVRRSLQRNVTVDGFTVTSFEATISSVAGITPIERKSVNRAYRLHRSLQIAPLRVRLFGPKTFCFVDRLGELYPVIDRADPIRRHVLISVSGSLIRSKDLQVSSLNFPNDSHARAVAIDDWHASNCQLKQLSSVLVEHRYSPNAFSGGRRSCYLKRPHAACSFVRSARPSIRPGGRSSGGMLLSIENPTNLVLGYRLGCLSDN